MSSTPGKIHYLDNMGRPNWRGPVGVSDSILHLDTRALIDVFLVVKRGEPSQDPHWQHWLFQWSHGTSKIGSYPIVRRLQVTQEAQLDHLTNWGAVSTSTADVTPENSVFVLLKKMSVKERAKFERICEATRVRAPDGHWNCQNWCQEALAGAVREGILTREEVARAVREAESV